MENPLADISDAGIVRREFQTQVVVAQRPVVLLEDDRDVTGDGSLMALDEYGNARGGIRNPYVDVPVARYSVRNEGAVPPVANAQPWVALRGEAGINQLCALTGYQLPVPGQTLKTLYKNKADYQARVERRLNELERQGWSLPLYRTLILGDAAKVMF